MKLNATISIIFVFSILLMLTSFTFSKKSSFGAKHKYRIKYGGCNQWKGPLTIIDKQIILNAHNWFRNEIALQINTVGPKIPFAKNMLQMYWSDAVAIKAQEWANQCRFEYSISTFRKQPDFQTGENIFEARSIGTYQQMNWDKAITEWFNEIRDFGGKNVDSMSTGGPVTGHFTQVIWANSYIIGCGFAQHKDGNWFSSLYICQYGPVGNVVGMAIYDSSPTKACVCPAGTACGNTTFTGLCCPNDGNACNWKTQTYGGPIIPGTVPQGIVGY